MFAEAANAVARIAETDTKGDTLLPNIKDLQKVSKAVAVAVADAAVKDNVATVAEQNVNELVEAAVWQPVYKPVEAKNE